VEESEEDEDEDKSNITFDEEDIKEAYEDVMQLENKSTSKNNMEDKTIKNIENENDNDNINKIICENNA
jgi:hypothetical protein